MNPARLLPDEIFPAAIRLIHRELMPGASPARQCRLLALARFLAKAHRKLMVRQRMRPPAPYIGLLPPRDAYELVTWGNHLRLQREATGLTRWRLARLSGVAISTIRNLEAGRHVPTRAVVMRLQAVHELGLPSPPERELIPPPQAHAVKVQLAAPGFSCGCWFEPEYHAIKLARDMVQRFNGSGGYIDQKFLYTDQASAVAWCAVTADKDYPQRRLPIAALAHELAALIGTRPVDVMGLGAGEAKEEVRLVQALLRHGDRDLRLFLLDISQPLLSAGYKHAASRLPDVGVFAIQGNFHDLPSYTSLFEPTARRRVLCMFGDTFCTVENELLFIRNSLCGLAPGDLFIVDVPLAIAATAQLAALTHKWPPNPVPLPKKAPGLWNRLHEFLVIPFRRYVRGVQSVSISESLDVEAERMPGSYAVDFRAHVQTASGPERIFSVGGMSKRYSPSKLCACLARLGWESLRMWRYSDERHPRLLFVFRKGNETP